MDARDAFATLSFWTTDFVGVGPYRLDRWEPGAFIIGAAFPGYVNGKPRIGRIQLVWIADGNTAVANLLSGTVDLATDDSIAFEQVSVLKKEWAGRSDRGAVLLATAKTVHAQVQYRPEWAKPSAMLDVRFRQALAYAMDKQALVDAVLDGEPGTADTLPAKEEEYYPELDRVLSKYPLDPRLAEQILGEMGFGKDGEGFYSQAGARLRPEIQVAGGGTGYQREALILSDGWKRVGIDAALQVLSPVEQASQEIQASASALRITQFGIGDTPFPNPFLPFVSSGLATAATRWAGRNKGGYSDPEIDRLGDLFVRSLDRTERNQAVIQGMKRLSDQAAYYPLYYAYEVVAHGRSLVGPRAGSRGTAFWNVEEWRWQ
jgi:peptide/nickel transport system substrate-binding protein